MAFEMGLINQSSHAIGAKLWPLRPHPLPDEVLSSWIARVALAHGVDLTCFAREVCSTKRIMATTIDTKPPSELMKILATRSGIALDQIYRMTLIEITNPENPQTCQGPQGMTSLIPGMVYDTVTSGAQYCLECLASDPIPYIRRRWKLSIVSACPRHNRVLLDRCHHCNKVSDFRFAPRASSKNQGNQIQASCRWCGINVMRMKDVDSLDSASPMALWLQDKILSIIDQKPYIPKGWRISLIKFPLDLHFILDLHFVIQSLRSNTRRALDFRERFHQFNEQDIHNFWPMGRVREIAFYRLSTRDRHAFMAASGSILRLDPSKTGRPKINLDHGSKKLPASIKQFLMTGA
jgi:hypothetical protein